MASVRVERTDEGGFVARNDRGAEVAIGGSDDDGVFSPVELLLAALGGCEIVTIEPLTAQRGHRLVRLAATVQAEKVAPTRLGTITVTYDVELPPGDDEAAEVFADVAHRVHEKHCTVGRALREVTPTEQILPKDTH
ncbi:MAG: redox protein regulator of disulfide bond formation-like protein [Actinoallomurus sp.]|jgi:putative redox protein|nr:redox protein regulator of disulfide bond formation-like protein [Actinoallomurus sp.]